LRLPLKNISRGGALVHSHVALPAESVHTVRLDANGEAFTTRVRVKHVTEVSSDGERTYLLGVEFVATHPGLFAMIEKLATALAGDGYVAGL